MMDRVELGIRTSVGLGDGFYQQISQMFANSNALD